VKRYSYLLGQTDLFKHFVDIKVKFFRDRLMSAPYIPIYQRARDPEYAALLDAQPKPKGRGRKKAM
jgi:SWI/SNF-related matrix-associated actin-dependent regulator of chromatin subfamily A member 5